MVPVRTMKVHGLAYGCQETINNKFSAIRLQTLFWRTDLFRYLLKIRIWTIWIWPYMVIHGTMNVYGHIYGCQETMNLNFFQSFNRDFSPLKYVTGTYFRLLQPTFEISYGQVYGCQVFLVTIYGLDMVAKIYLWWSTREGKAMMITANHYVPGKHGLF